MIIIMMKMIKKNSMGFLFQGQAYFVVNDIEQMITIQIQIL